MILVLALVAAGAGAGWLVGHYTASSSTKTVTAAAAAPTVTSPTSAAQIEKAPNFTADDLSAAPTDNWPTVGGSLRNERYSPLDQIDTSNVSQLKGVWMTHLDGSGVGAKYSAESQPVVWKGVMYVSTGNNDVFAVSVATGKILWKYTSGISQKITTVCCGWLNRGVAIGDGRVYFGQLDGEVVALDQQTGKPVWTRQLVQWQLGQTITAAPIYVDGTIYIGVVGAEFGTRSFLQALDAATGKQVWRWYTTAGPGDPGGDTWPAGSKEYLRGGATIWQAPAVDPKLGLIYFSTGNAGSDWFGGERPGKNLYAASIVALDLKTGHLKWYFQQVHHDIWDFDSASPVVLFDVGGHQGIAQASKTGWLYMLDRATGKPLYGITETPVPQNAEQQTWPTQPIPNNGTAEFVPNGAVPAKDVERVKSQAVGPLAKVPQVVAKVPFTPPPPGKLLIYGMGPQGGVNWQPVSYNEKTHMIYVCSAVSWVGFQAQNTPFVAPGKNYTGVAGAAGVAWPEGTGTFTRSTRRAARSSGRRRSPSRATQARRRVPATSCSSAATRASCRRTTPRPVTCSGASRRAPARTTRRRSSSRTARSTSRSSRAATRWRRLHTGTTSGCSRSTARSARRRHPARAPGRSTAARAAARPPRARRSRAMPSRGRRSSRTTASPATAPTDTAVTAGQTSPRFRARRTTPPWSSRSRTGAAACRRSRIS